MALAALSAGQIFALNSGGTRIDFTQVDTTASIPAAPQFNPFGLEIYTNKGPAEYCLVGVGGVTAGDVCLLTTALVTGLVTAVKGYTTNLPSGTPNNIGVAISTAAAGAYAWFLTGPFNLVPVNVANAVTAGTALTSTATQGQIGTGGTAILGLLTLETAVTSTLTSATAVRGLGIA